MWLLLKLPAHYLEKQTLGDVAHGDDAEQEGTLPCTAVIILLLTRIPYPVAPLGMLSTQARHAAVFMNKKYNSLEKALQIQQSHAPKSHPILQLS